MTHAFDVGPVANGFMAKCLCHWQSQRRDTREQALESGRQHVSRMVEAEQSGGAR